MRWRSWALAMIQSFADRDTEELFKIDHMML